METKTPAYRWIMLALGCELVGLFALFLYYGWQRHWLQPVGCLVVALLFVPGALYRWSLGKRTARQRALVGWCVLASAVGVILCFLLAFLLRSSSDAFLASLCGGAFLIVAALRCCYPARDTPAGRWGGRIAIGWVGGMIVVGAICFIRAMLR